MKNPILKSPLIVVMGLLLGGTGFAQRQMENLNRGVVAVKKNATQIYVSWRLFGNDPTTVAFNLYRSANGGAAGKINGASPLTTTTDYTDTPASLSTTTYSYFVRPVINGVEQADSETATLAATTDVKSYLSVPLRTDTGPNGPYDVKFCWVGDLDGDGDYDYVVDRLSTTASQEQFLEAYKNDGTFLWRMAMGPNSTNQYAYEPGSSAISIGDTDNVTVYDMDGDGKAEVLVRTANGVSVKNALGTQVTTVTDANNANQFLSVIDGLSGTELGRTALPNAWAVHGTLTSKAMIAYLDGKRPSVVMYGYNRADSGTFYRQFTAFDFRNGTLTQRWTLPQTFPGSEGHQVRIADVDNDGKDEICDLGHVIDDNGTQLFYNELTHGDRFHIADIDPDRPGLETYAIQQYNPSMLATAFYDSRTGVMMKKWYANGLVDVGRGIALDLTPAYKGYEMYSTQPGLYNAKGQQISANNLWAPEGLWWDGDLAREFIDGAGSGALNPVINKFNTTTGVADRLWSLYNDNGAYSTHQAYGGRPAFWGDILGDWREELVLVASDYSELRIYTTTIAATNRLYTLMHNPQYRCQATTKGYVQASYVDYYLGYNMPSAVPPPAMISSTLTWAAGSTWDDGVSSSWKNATGVSSTYTSGDSVLFDISGSNTSGIALNGSLTPGAVSFFNPQDFTLNGTSGSLTGNMTFSKSGAGKTTLVGPHSYTGATTIWDGALVVNGQLSGSPVTVWGGIWGGSLAMGATGGRLAGSGTVSQPVSLQYRGAITPGTGMGNAATLTLGSSLTAADGSVLALDLSDDPTGVSKVNDRITVAGNLVLSGTVAIDIKALNSQLLPGTYTLLTYGGTLTGSLSNLSVTVPDGTPYVLAVGSGSITLTIPVTRAPGAVVWRGTGGATWNLASSQNWLLGGNPSVFVSGDNVTFNDTGIANAAVTLAVPLPVAGMTVSSSGNYSFSGSGAIAGSGGLTKSGTGTLTLSNTNSYTGPTTITGGTVAVDNLNDGGSPSSIGAAGTAAANLVLNGGTLSLVGLQTNTNRSMTLGTGGGTLSIPTASTSLQISGSLTGTGSLTKTGPGTLILAASSSYSGGTFISEGTVTLASDSVNISGLGSGLVTLNGGTLSMTNSTSGSDAPVSAWSLNVPTGFSGRLNADGRSTLSGALTGGGDFTYYTPFIRTDLTGNWSAFTGRIFVVSDADGGEFRIKNTSGYAAAQLDLGDQVSAFYNNTSGNITLQVGALSGVSTSDLSGGLSSGGTITWQVGARNQDTTFAGVIANNIGPAALTKVGTGTLTLSGASTYTGATTVSAGRLQINGSTSATSYTVQSGGTLGGTGTINGNVTVQAGGALEHGISGATPLAITGNLSFGANAVIRPVAGGSFATGTYTVLTYSGTLTGTPVLSWDPPAGSTMVATFSTATPGVITMTLSPGGRGPGPVTWTGSTSFNWDTATSNWTSAGSPTAFLTGDTVSFTNTGNAASAINLVSDVQPAAVIVNSTQNYTFSGTGLITGTATLAKSGSGTLTLTGIHTTSGAVAISGGILSVTQTGTGASAVSASAGSGAVTLSGGGTFKMGSADGKNFPGNPLVVFPASSGVLSSAALSNGYAGTISGSADSILTLSGPVSASVSGSPQFAGFAGTVIVPSGSQLRYSSTSGANGNGGANTTFQIDGTLNTRNAGGAGGVVIGALTGGGSVQGQTNTATGTVAYNIGAKNLDTTFSGVIANGANGTAAINKLGSGILTLSGVNTYTGATTVTAGKLSVTGSLAVTTVTVAITGTLGGTGSIAGAVTCNGALAPGTAAGTLTLSAGLTLASTSTLAYELGTTSDRTAVTGNLTLDGTVNVSAATGFAAGTYTLITYTGTLTNNTLNVGTLPAGYNATVNTTTAGQVRLVVTSSNAAPQISVAAAASPSSLTTSNLTVSATDDGGEPGLTYTWSSTGPASVGFSTNATNSAKNAVATFSAPGSYTLTVTVQDVPGLTAVSSVVVNVTATPVTLTVSPPGATLAVNATQSFTATAQDQFGTPVSNPSVTWSASGVGGSIDQQGVYSATAPGGPWQVSAALGGLLSASPVTVIKASATVTLGNLAVTYDGTPKPVSTVTNPPGMTVILTYDGSATPPTIPGTYAVAAVIDNANYAGGTSGSLVIASRSFGNWETSLFTPEQIAAGESAPGADPDHDSLTNLAEYALGAQPYAFTPQPAVSSDATSLSITFQRPAWVGDVIYQAEASPDFNSWSALTLEVLTPGADPETVRAIYTLPEPKPAGNFLRLRFEK